MALNPSFAITMLQLLWFQAISEQPVSGYLRATKPTLPSFLGQFAGILTKAVGRAF